MAKTDPPEMNGGDPGGRRIARRRALLLAEAAQLARALEVLLQRADFDPALCVQLIKELSAQEQTELLRSYGRVASRKRFKHSCSHPLLLGRPLNHLYVDESGKSSREPGTQPTFFALAAVAMDGEDVDAYRAAADAIKREFFGRTDITFHEPDMRNYDGIYWFKGNRPKQGEFDTAISHLVASTKFTAFGVGIRKHAFHKQFVEGAVDPYLPTNAYSLAIIMLLERYVDFLATRSANRMGFVTFESQGPREDVYHQLEYARVLVDGSQWVPESAFRHWLLPGLRFTPKRGSDPTELADMFAREVFEWIRSDCSVEPKRWDLFCGKIHCRADGRMGKFGVKVFPDHDIRERIEDHRIRCGARP